MRRMWIQWRKEVAVTWDEIQRLLREDRAGTVEQYDAAQAKLRNLLTCDLTDMGDWIEHLPRRLYNSSAFNKWCEDNYVA